MESEFEKLEKELKDIWVEYGNSTPVKGLHTQITVEPQVFIGKHLNNEIADLLAQIYLSKLGPQDVKDGKVTLKEDVLTINSGDGKPLVEVRSQTTIRQFISKLR